MERKAETTNQPTEQIRMNHPGDRARSSVFNTHQANKHTRITAAINLKGRKNAYDRRRYSKHTVMDFHYCEILAPVLPMLWMSLAHERLVPRVKPLPRINTLGRFFVRSNVLYWLYCILFFSPVVCWMICKHMTFYEEKR